MKIDSLETIPIAIDRNEVFTISTGSSLTAENVIVRVESEGVVGWGNASANSVTEETTESILKALKNFKPEIVGKNVEIENNWKEWNKVLPEAPSALAGLDIALYDAKGKLENKSVLEFLGGKNEGIPTDRTIGHMTKSETVEHAREFVDKGFRALKIKIGLGLMEDVKRVRAVRKEVGNDIDIWVDANQAFTPEESITLCQKLEETDIKFVEQPVRVNDIEGLKKVTEETDIPIMADETVKDPEMAERICQEEIADMINIKLAKCGGLTGGRKIVEIMEEYDVEGMVGCMGETSVSIAAGSHLYNSTLNLKYADLDSHFMLSDNIASGLEFKDGKLWISEEPGLGMKIDTEKLDKYRMNLKGKQ
ncbi:MAG: dipeptide epimerase [Candidatus Thermoplasmatota archaeon]|nr:dipeptide epimerase [Candidatus Thermoplasmatota archaeon]MBS3790529.1 dipeptide epimerase [Candidatus Thermoplasmatota archaeon]